MISADSKLGNYLFGLVELTNFHLYSYSRYDIGFHARGFFSLSDCSLFGKNVIIL